nr:Anaerobic sulfatase-maturating enzyme homolog YdeM [Klebsiella pneumoniae]
MQSGLSVLLLSGKRGSASGVCHHGRPHAGSVHSQHHFIDPSQNVEFCWQGGEPTLCGLDFFAKVVELQQRYRGNKIIANSLQTNGILLNDKWARFLRRHGFLVGLSIDGPASLHDTGVRRAAENPPGKVVQAIRCLQQHDVPVNAMVVVSRQSASRGKVSIAA